jgi:hypothetical protein
MPKMDLAVDDLIQENSYITINEIVSSAHTIAAEQLVLLH